MALIRPPIKTDLGECPNPFTGSWILNALYHPVFGGFEYPSKEIENQVKIAVVNIPREDFDDLPSQNESEQAWESVNDGTKKAYKPKILDFATFCLNNRFNRRIIQNATGAFRNYLEHVRKKEGVKKWATMKPYHGAVSMLFDHTETKFNRQSVKVSKIASMKILYGDEDSEEDNETKFPIPNDLFLDALSYSLTDYHYKKNHGEAKDFTKHQRGMSLVGASILLADRPGDLVKQMNTTKTNFDDKGCIVNRRKTDKGKGGNPEYDEKRKNKIWFGYGESNYPLDIYEPFDDMRKVATTTKLNSKGKRGIFKGLSSSKIGGYRKSDLKGAGDPVKKFVFTYIGDKRINEDVRSKYDANKFTAKQLRHTTSSLLSNHRHPETNKRYLDPSLQDIQKGHEEKGRGSAPTYEELDNKSKKIYSNEWNLIFNNHFHNKFHSELYKKGDLPQRREVPLVMNRGEYSDYSKKLGKRGEKPTDIYQLERETRGNVQRKKPNTSQNAPANLNLSHAISTVDSSKKKKKKKKSNDHVKRKNVDEDKDDNEDEKGKSGGHVKRKNVDEDKDDNEDEKGKSGSVVLGGTYQNCVFHFR